MCNQVGRQYEPLGEIGNKNGEVKLKKEYNNEA